MPGGEIGGAISRQARRAGLGRWEVAWGARPRDLALASDLWPPWRPREAGKIESVSRECPGAPSRTAALSRSREARSADCVHES